MSTELQTTTDLRAAFEDIKELFLQGKALEAFDKYYADTVVMQENEAPATIGKAENRQREEEFFGKVTELRGIEFKGVAFGDDLVISEWYYDYTHADWGDRRYHQVSVQRWQNGKVVHERFYYGA
ncbi:MAG: nuclear transport factor 2 family protein [Cyanobacteria bacterium Co-bin13]|nr:nuclear transport factor 2 family protein [Cyanobacteria bacterium Co-bin13]